MWEVHSSRVDLILGADAPPSEHVCLLPLLAAALQGALLQLGQYGARAVGPVPAVEFRAIVPVDGVDGRSEFGDQKSRW